MWGFLNRAFFFLDNILAMAGNIIPAIASTNAIVAGLIVLEAIKVLAQRKPITEACRSVFVARAALGRDRVLSSVALQPPNPQCFVCAARPQVVVSLDTGVFTVGALVDRVLKGTLGMQVVQTGLCFFFFHFTSLMCFRRHPT